MEKRVVDTAVFAKRRILFVPLDWGLGHATRLVPWIEEAVRGGDEVWIGGNGRSGAWLKERFPNLPFEEAPAWALRHTGNLAWDLIKDSRAYRRSLRADRLWATEIVNRLQLTHLVSDHRLGLRAQGAKATTVHHVLVIHQLTLALPFLWRWPVLMQGVSLTLWALLRPYWSSFQELWIPDTGQAGTALAPHLSMLPWVKDGPRWSTARDQRGRWPRFRYLGWRSRFEGMSPKITEYTGDAWPEESAILVVLSGPEPARSRFEALVIAQWESWGKAQGDQASLGDRPSVLWLVRGLPGSSMNTDGMPPIKGLMAWESPDDHTMIMLLSKAEWIVSRAGYSSCMDYACLRSWWPDRTRPWRICTVYARGHSEQAYLGHRLKRMGQADFRRESTFDLREAWLNRGKFTFTYAFTSSPLESNESSHFV
ncbi:MAG: hypothetical protein FJX86_01960 [Bacteroidetes bacterium]|nr:hypothetical protein [Bacteroidota bacterium]